MAETRQYKPVGSSTRRAVIIDGRATSLYLSDDYWRRLEKHCRDQELSRRVFISRISKTKGSRSLAQAVRDVLDDLASYP